MRCNMHEGNRTYMQLFAVEVVVPQTIKGWMKHEQIPGITPNVYLHCNTILLYQHQAQKGGYLVQLLWKFIYKFGNTSESRALEKQMKSGCPINQTVENITLIEGYTLQNLRS